ncbi:MAG: hypothetical protein RL095_165 [Verrucomicrobiota bacterium]|jgi:hypothetical protein
MTEPIPQKKASRPKKLAIDSASTPPSSPTTAAPEELFGRVAAILEQARGEVVRAVNSQMVLAYWLIGREIVQELQGGQERAAYGKRLLQDLSLRLTERYGQGFSLPNLKRFRQFFLSYADRGIGSPAGSQCLTEKDPQWGANLEGIHPKADATNLSLRIIPGVQASDDRSPRGFSPQLTWSHYRALMRVEDLKARDFYEHEAIAGGWDKRTLERQIHTSSCVWKSSGNAA